MWSRRLFLCLLLALAPGAAYPISLHWASGVDTLTFAEPTRCVLIVRADEGQPLPPEWRLLWLADSSGVNFVAEGEAIACASDTARVSAVSGPVSAPDSAAHLVRIPFCSAGTSAASVAVFLLDQPGGSAGRLKVVALDPGDMTGNRVLASNEVTYNGGVSGEYPPAILGVRSDHSTTVLRVDVVGSGLGGLDAVRVSSPEIGPDLAMNLSERSDSAVAATANLPVPLVSTTVLLEDGGVPVSTAGVPDDPVTGLLLPNDAVFVDVDPNVYPKDFALINVPTPVGGGQWQNLFHLYYIRQYKTGRPDTLNGNTFGHAWSRDLVHWEQRPDVFAADTLNIGAWDYRHVWAPSLIRHGLAYWMFYTGVNRFNDQTIGYATTSTIDTIDASGQWARQASPVHTPVAANAWACQEHPWQFRDPFVMVDPESPVARYLMFYTAKTSGGNCSHYAVGVAQSGGSGPGTWNDIGYYVVTDSLHNFARALESPHVFPDSIHHDPIFTSQATWRLMYTDGGWSDSSRAVMFNTKAVGVSLTSLAESSWSPTPTMLFDYLHLTQQSPEYGHQASEIVQIGGTYYWGGYDGSHLRFRKLRWDGSIHFRLTDVELLAAESTPPARDIGLRLRGLSPGQGQVRFRIELPARMRARLAVYDVMGRVIRSLREGDFPAGGTDLSWNGQHAQGGAVGSGIYFACLEAGGARSVVRVPLVR